MGVVRVINTNFDVFEEAYEMKFYIMKQIIPKEYDIVFQLGAKVLHVGLMHPKLIEPDKLPLMQYFLNKVNLEWFFLPTHVQLLNKNEIVQVIKLNFEHLCLTSSLKLLGGGSAQKEVGPRTEETWQLVRDNSELIDCINEVNIQLSQLSKIDWKNIEEKLKTDVTFCRCFESFFNVYDRMQGELGEPKRTRGLTYNANLTCIFYYYGEIEIYKTHYLCKLPCRIFKKHKDSMFMLLKNTILCQLANIQKLPFSDNESHSRTLALINQSHDGIHQLEEYTNETQTQRDEQKNLNSFVFDETDIPISTSDYGVSFGAFTEN